MSDEAYTINVEGLNKILKALKSKPPTARVGILGGGAHYAQLNTGAAQPKGMTTNAEIGAVHEFGSIARNIAPRSFLRVPISEHLQKEMENSGALDVETMNEVLRQGSVIPWLKKVSTIAKGIVLEAFATGGFGKWPAWKNPNYTNNAGQLLVDTTQLRDSIVDEVKE